MAADTATYRPSRAFWLSIPLVAAVTWGAHELTHVLAGRLLGYDMWMSLNQAGPVEGEYASREHRMIVAMAGPVVTYLQAAIAFWLIRTRGAGLAYPALFLAAFMRLLAFAVGISNPNDEARTSLDLGWPAWALPSIVVAVLLAMCVVGSRSLRVGWRTNGLLYLAASAIATAIVFADPLVGRILGG